MMQPLMCATHGSPVLADVLVVHPHLFRMVTPLCSPCGLTMAAPADIFVLNSPEGREVLETHTILRGWVVPRPES